MYSPATPSHLSVFWKQSMRPAATAKVSTPSVTWKHALVPVVQWCFFASVAMYGCVCLHVIYTLTVHRVGHGLSLQSHFHGVCR